VRRGSRCRRRIYAVAGKSTGATMEPRGLPGAGTSLDGSPRRVRVRGIPGHGSQSRWYDAYLNVAVAGSAIRGATIVDVAWRESAAAARDRPPLRRVAFGPGPSSPAEGGPMGLANDKPGHLA
jgi:hypothetical protein